MALVVEILRQPALPGGRQVERADEGREQRDVAHADVGPGEAVKRGRLEGERERLGVGRRGVGAPEGFDAGLEELGRAFAAMAEDRPEIAETRRPSGLRRGEIVERDRNGEIGAQAELAAGRIVHQIHAAADVLARQIEERLRRLQDGGRGRRIAGALIGGDERVRARVFRRLGHSGGPRRSFNGFRGPPCSTSPRRFRS